MRHNLQEDQLVVGIGFGTLLYTYMMLEPVRESALFLVWTTALSPMESLVL
jgi:hypothetical protein